MADIKGIVGEKLGMTQIFVETRAVPVTVIKAGPCVVTQVQARTSATATTPCSSRYGTVRPPRRHQARARATSTRRAPSPRATWSSSAPTTPASYEAGQEVTADVFEVGEKVDVVGRLARARGSPA